MQRYEPKCDPGDRMLSENLDLQKIQISCIDTLKDVAEICEDNDLSYYLCAGTLLGAVRHKGFIPWDDDVDLMMPRRDYDRLIEIANEKLNSNHRLIHYSKEKNLSEINAHHVQVVDTNIKLLREWTVNQKTICCWIDIFPVDGMPKGKLASLIHYYHFKFWKYIYQLSRFEDCVNVVKDRPQYQIALLNVLKKFNPFHQIDSVKALYKMEKIAKKYDVDRSERVCCFYGLHNKKEILKTEWFANKIRLTFEDGDYWGPERYDDFLRNYYGDYMVIPKEEDRLSHNFKII